MSKTRNRVILCFGFETLKARPLKIRVSNCDDGDDECDSCSSVHDDNDVVVSKASTECTQVEVSLEIKTIERREISGGVPDRTSRESGNRHDGVS